MHLRWQTLDILLKRSVIISISIFAAVNLASAAGVGLAPPRNQDMVLFYVAPPRWWIDWCRVDGVSLRRRASRCSGASVAEVGVAGPCWKAHCTCTDGARVRRRMLMICSARDEIWSGAGAALRGLRGKTALACCKTLAQGCFQGQGS